MNYQIESKTEKGRKKENFEHNGDCCGWIDEAGCVVLALADGVGSCADDARASKTTCDLFLEKCRMALNGHKVLATETLSKFCCEIDPILAVDNDMACFCAVVWYKSEEKVTWLHVGDTRIYRYRKADGLVQVTKDDHGKPVNIKVNGKLYTDHGAVVSATPINNAIGDRGCDFHTGSFGFLPGDSIILCSDGMYNSSSFGNDLVALLNEDGLEDAIRKLTTTDDDDASILVLRRNITMDVEIDDLMAHFDSYQESIPLNALIDRFANELETMLVTDFDMNRMEKIIALMEKQKLYPEKKRIEGIFTEAVKRYHAMPEGEEKQYFNDICQRLKTILTYVYKH